MNASRRTDRGLVLENIAYGYARNIGNEVNVGRVGKLECYFGRRGRDPNRHRCGIVHENVAELIGEGRTFGLTLWSVSPELDY